MDNWQNGETRSFREQCAILIGQRRGRIWHARLRKFESGKPTSVEFNWAYVLEREERYGDIVGFYHTHPVGLITTSRRDVQTMRAWVSCLGKPLLCVIASDTTLSAYVFETDEDSGTPLAEIQRFPRNVMVGVVL